jgi:hypothetical protein
MPDAGKDCSKANMASGGRMDFVEKLFHVSFDGGNGTIEVACVAILLTPLVLTVLHKAAQYLTPFYLSARPGR